MRGKVGNVRDPRCNLIYAMEACWVFAKEDKL